MNMYEGVLEFKGNWRTYQKRILDRADRYLEDGKIHIVAAPGSGKTTLGIELIRETGSALSDLIAQYHNPSAVDFADGGRVSGGGKGRERLVLQQCEKDKACDGDHLSGSFTVV